MKIYILCAGTPNGDILAVDRFVSVVDAQARMQSLKDPAYSEVLIALNIDDLWVEEQEIVDEGLA